MIRGVRIEPEARELMILETLSKSRVETGGILVGYYSEDVLVITSASGPGRNAYHSPIEFIMDKMHMHDFLDKVHSESNGNNIYIGEWHTHPQTFPSPSEVDIQSIIERVEEWHYGDLAFIIIGANNFSSYVFEEQIILLTYMVDERNIIELPLLSGGADL